MPVGAIAAGACAASGYYVGAVISGRRPAALAAAFMRASGLVFYAALCLLPLQGWTTGAGPARPLPSSDTGAIHAVSLDPSGLHRATVTGLLAYPLTILAGLGFAVGAAAVTTFSTHPSTATAAAISAGAADGTAAWPACDFDPRTRPPASGPTIVALLVRRPQPARVDT